MVTIIIQKMVLEWGRWGCSCEVPAGPVGRAEPHDSVGRQSHTFTQQVFILATLVVRPRFPGQPKHVTKHMQHNFDVFVVWV